MIKSLIDDEKAILIPLPEKESERARSYLRRSYCPWVPGRYVLAVMIGLGFTIVYGLRVNLSVALVQMDNNTATVHKGSARVFYLLLHGYNYICFVRTRKYGLTHVPTRYCIEKGICHFTGGTVFQMIEQNIESCWQ